MSDTNPFAGLDPIDEEEARDLLRSVVIKPTPAFYRTKQESSIALFDNLIACFTSYGFIVVRVEPSPAYDDPRWVIKPVNYLLPAVVFSTDNKGDIKSWNVTRSGEGNTQDNDIPTHTEKKLIYDPALRLWFGPKQQDGRRRSAIVVLVRLVIEEWRKAEDRK